MSDPRRHRLQTVGFTWCKLRRALTKTHRLKPVLLYFARRRNVLAG
jgi:hypothetical protein